MRHFQPIVVSLGAPTAHHNLIIYLLVCECCSWLGNGWRSQLPAAKKNPWQLRSGMAHLERAGNFSTTFFWQRRSQYIYWYLSGFGSILWTFKLSENWGFTVLCCMALLRAPSWRTIFFLKKICKTNKYFSPFCIAKLSQDSSPPPVLLWSCFQNL